MVVQKESCIVQIGISGYCLAISGVTTFKTQSDSICCNSFGNCL